MLSKDIIQETIGRGEEGEGHGWGHRVEDSQLATRGILNCVSLWKGKGQT